MKLRTSKLCLDCESIYEGGGPCPDCASEVFFWVFQALGTALNPMGMKARNDGLEGGDGIPSRVMSSLGLPRRRHADLSSARPGHPRSHPNFFTRLGEMMTRVGTAAKMEGSEEKLSN